MDQAITTSRAGIIINFYGRRGKLKPLQKRIGIALNLVRAQGEHKDMSDDERGIHLYVADPPNAPDTSIIHLAVGDPNVEPAHDAETVWEKWLRIMQEADFNQILDEAVAETDEERQAVFWGYSLIFHAAFAPAIDPSQPPPALLKLARRPGQRQWEPVEPLAYSQLEGSHLWLLDTPNEGHGSQAASVYVALLPQDKEPILLTKLYYGRSALLLDPDLFAHKSYYQRRQFVGLSANDDSLRQKYKNQLITMPNLVAPLLGVTLANQTQTAANQTEQLHQLNEAYTRLLFTTSLLNEPHLSLAEQKKNYEWYGRLFGQNNDVYEYHHQQIILLYEELGLLLDKGQTMLEAARTTTEMIQAKLSQKQAKQERITQAILAVVGLALACPQLVDPTAAQAFYNFFSDAGLTPADEARLLQLLVQLVVMILIGGLVALWIRLKPADEE